MSWQVLIDYGAGWVDLSSYGTEDLTRDSLQLTEKLHDKDFKPALGSVSFTASLTSTLATNLLSCADDIPCEIYEDGALFFRGIARPVTKYSVSEDQVVDFEIFDYGYALEKTLQNDFIINSGKVCDPADVASSVVHRLLDEAGYPTAYIGTLATISTIIPRLTLKAGTKYSDALANVLWDYHHLYTISGNGAFTVYDWAPTSISTAGTITESDIIDKLELERKDKEEDQVRVVYNRFLLKENYTLYYKKASKYAALEVDGDFATASPWPSPAGRFNYNKPPEGDGQLEILATENQSVYVSGYERYTKFSLFGLIDFDALRKVTSGFTLASASHATTYSDLQWTFPSSHRINEVKIVGDMYVVYKGGNKTSIYSIPGAAGRLKEYPAEYLYDGDAAKALAQAILSTIEHGGLFYSFKSETEYNLGGYYTLTSSSLNSSGPVRITSRKWDKVTEIWEYEAVSVGAMSVVAGSVIEGGYFIPTNPDEIASIVERVSAGLESDGSLLQPITGNALASISPDTPGLYMTADKLGYFDGEVWRSVIKDDGTFKFETSDGAYIEWDGTGTLKIMGDLFLSGNSELRGKVKTGDGVVSDNYIPGEAGWVIDGEGHAEFQDVIARGEMTGVINKTGGNVLSYDDIELGYENPESGITISPDDLILSAAAFGTSAIQLGWDPQSTLSNGYQYELQIADNTEGPWYSLRMDGTHWGDVQDAITSIDYRISRFIHPNIPPVGSLSGEEAYAEDPQGRELFYRIRQVTKLGDRSGWAYASATTSLLPTEWIPAGSIAANKLVANVITALFAQIEDFITVSADSGFISGYGDGEFPPIGARRSRIDGEKIGVQVHLGDGIWADVSSMDINKGLMSLGLQGGPALALYTGSFSHMAKDGFSIGREVPSGAIAFLFENSIQDFNSADYFDSGSATYTTKCKFGEYAAIGGGHLVKAGAFDIDQDDWTVEFWYRLTEIPTGFYEIFRVEGTYKRLIMAHVDRSDEYADAAYCADDYWNPAPDAYHKTELCLTTPAGTVNYQIDEDTPFGEWRYTAFGMKTDTATRKLFYSLGGDYTEAALADQVLYTDPATIEMLKDSRTWIDMLLIDPASALSSTFLYDSERAVVGYGSFRTEDSDMILWALGQMIIKQPVFKGDWMQAPVLTAGVTDAPNGAIYYDETAGKFKGRANGAWVDLH